MSWDWLDMVWHFPTPLWTKPHLVKCDLTADRNLNIIWFWSQPTSNGQCSSWTLSLASDQVIVNSTDVAQRPKTERIRNSTTQRLEYSITQRPKDSQTQWLKSWLVQRPSWPLSLASLRCWSHHCFPHWCYSIMRLQSIGGEAANDWQLLSFFLFLFCPSLSFYFLLLPIYTRSLSALSSASLSSSALYSCRHHHHLYYSKNVIHFYFPLCWEALPIQ